MEGGLLSLKWNNHRSTFLQVLSTVRHKESYCDVTLACDGKFYPVHKLVLSTCSEYFEQMFERTNCKHPIIVLKDINKDDLEALLNYMYVGEVNVLQNNLSGLIKAAEGLRIKGLAVPDEAPDTQDNSDSKRSVPWSSEEPETKRRRPDDTTGSPRHEKNTRDNIRGETRDNIRENVRETVPERVPERISERSPASYREYRPQYRTREPVSPAPHSPDPPHPPPPAPEPPPAPVELPAAPTLVSNADVASEPVRPPEREVKLDETIVKEEPHENYTEAEDSKEGLSEGDGINFSTTTPPGMEGGTSIQARYSPLRSTQQPQTLEDLVALPGASGLQGKSLWEGDRSILGLPYEYTNTQSATTARPSPMGQRSRNPSTPSELLGHTLARAIQYAHVCPVCGHLARQRKDLKKHLRVHTGEKPYACPICPYRSTQNSNLKTHMRRLHTNSALTDMPQPASTQPHDTNTTTSVISTPVPSTLYAD